MTRYGTCTSDYPLMTYISLVLSRSVSIADYAKTIDLPQIGFDASSSELSDPDKFAFFSRTYPSSSAQAFLLTNMLEELGLIQHIFVLYYDDYLGHTYYQDFATEYACACGQCVQCVASASYMILVSLLWCYVCNLTLFVQDGPGGTTYCLAPMPCRFGRWPTATNCMQPNIHSR